MQAEGLIEKIRNLPPEQIAEVEDFVDSLARNTTDRARLARHEAIAAYAARQAGTEADLDCELERAAVEQLLAGESEGQ